MRVADFDFDLPEHLIAQFPPQLRGSSRLLVALPYQPIVDTKFSHIIDYIESGDVLIFNNTKVMKARLFGHKDSGGKIEALVERVLDEHSALAHIRSSKSPKSGAILHFEGGIQAIMQQRMGELFQLHFLGDKNIYELLEENGHLPLPPYIERSANPHDDARYQTVYAKHQGAVAAPTAGLHFTHNILNQLKQKGIHIAEVTLHVGAGTFQPVRVEQIADHKMHSEWFHISQDTAALVNTAKQQGHKIWAVGTTSLRAMESSTINGQLQSGQGDTDIFITPNYSFKIVDRLITNFHLPKSTLLMLVSALAGYQHIRQVYQHAIEQEYRFFSYGDAMILGRN